jgi:hypothetical protein
MESRSKRDTLDVFGVIDLISFFFSSEGGRERRG